MPGRAGEETEAARGFAFTASILVTLFVAALIGRVLDDGATSLVHASPLVWPVTWQFYANSADQEYVVVYRESGNGETYDRLVRPLADLEHRWGLGHSAYAELARLRSTIDAIPPDAWWSCAAQEIAACSEVIAAAPRSTVVSRWEAGTVVFAIERSASGPSRRIERVAVVDLVPSR